MEDAIRLKAAEIKSLSRSDLEAAYILLLKTSLMKTQLIQFLEKSTERTAT